MRNQCIDLLVETCPGACMDVLKERKSNACVNVFLDNMGDFSDFSEIESKIVLRNACKIILKEDMKCMNKHKKDISRKISRCEEKLKNYDNIEDYEGEIFKNISTMQAEKAEITSTIIDSFMELALSRGPQFTEIFFAIPKERKDTYINAHTRAMNKFILESLNVGKIW